MPIKLTYRIRFHGKSREVGYIFNYIYLPVSPTAQVVRSISVIILSTSSLTCPCFLLFTSFCCLIASMTFSSSGKATNDYGWHHRVSKHKPIPLPKLFLDKFLSRHIVCSCRLTSQKVQILTSSRAKSAPLPPVTHPLVQIGEIIILRR